MFAASFAPWGNLLLRIKGACAGSRYFLQVINHEAVEKLTQFTFLGLADLESPKHGPFAVCENLRHLARARAELGIFPIRTQTQLVQQPDFESKNAQRGRWTGKNQSQCTLHQIVDVRQW